jgi:hypothetical protein
MPGFWLGDAHAALNLLAKGPRIALFRRRRGVYPPPPGLATSAPEPERPHGSRSPRRFLEQQSLPIRLSPTPTSGSVQPFP